MATDTVPAATPGPPDPPNTPATTAATGQTPSKGFLASMVSAVEPARATFDIVPTTGTDTPAGADGVLDRSAPGVSSASYRDADQATANDPDGRQRKAQGSIWKAWWLAGAQRWAKGGGTANKRLDLRKAKANSHQVKENRTTTFSRSGPALVKNSMGSGSGTKQNGSKSGGNSHGKGPVNSSGNRSNTHGRDGSGGRSGSHGPAGADTRKQSGGRGQHGQGGKGSSGAAGADGSRTSGKHTDGSRDSKTKAPKHSTDKPGHAPGSGSSGGTGKQGADGKSGAHGKDGKTGGAGHPGGQGASGKHTGTSSADTRTPLEKSREIGHKDGGSVRNVVDHVKAYKDGVADGYRDKKDENAKEHDRLDKAHEDHKTAKADAERNTKPTDPAKPTSGTENTGGDGRPPLKTVVNGQPITITDDNAPLEDPLMKTPTPIQAQGIDATTITLGDGFLKNKVSRGELRRFKQYEGRLEARITGLAQVADATRALAAQARDQATECQNLAEQAKNVKGGEKLVAALTRLADNAKAQAEEADEVNKTAVKAHDFAKAVLSNIQTRYAPLYQAVVDSDETKPAELKFYTDRGVTPTETALAA
ncbi:hypothetical protein ACGFZS_46815 [Streptomyces sp. NPDC048288]|uniref:hypothetical protein n=1 Tax=Streptomyces sp. NPDC048288 TaxID=3365529 RepID=UPI003712DB76